MKKKVGRYSKNIQKNIQKIFKKYSKNIRKIFSTYSIEYATAGEQLASIGWSSLSHMQWLRKHTQCSP